MTHPGNGHPGNGHPGGAVEVARPAKAPVRLGGPIGDIDTMWRLAQALAQSSLIPKDLRGKTNDVFVILLYGQELGLAPMQSLQEVYVVNNRPRISGALWLAKARMAGHKVEFPTRTPEKAVVRITRCDNGDTITSTYTIQDAKTAKLAAKETYQQHPTDMLTWRAVGKGCKLICPEVAMGFGVLGVDEPGDIEAIEATAVPPSLAEAAQARETTTIQSTSTPTAPVTSEAVRDEVLAIAAERAGAVPAGVNRETGEIDPTITAAEEAEIWADVRNGANT